MNAPDYAALVARQRAHFASGATRPLTARVAALQTLRTAMGTWEGRILDAVKADLGKPQIEAYTAEIGMVLSEIDHALRHVKAWMKPRKLKGPWMAWPSRGWLSREPLGVALILAPWNYPVQLLLSPLIGAIAGGNCAIVKPSEVAPNTAAVMADLLKETFRPEHICCVTGDKTAAEGLLDQKFDTIFYTGNAAIGRRVMAAAAKHLTPVTLELGGKCPCIVTADTRIDVAAKRVVWAKMMNAGQTCVAPDFVYVQESVREPFLTACAAALTAFYGNDPQKSPDYGRIVNTAHFRRLTAYLADGTLFTGGTSDETTLYLAPTLLTNVSPTSPVMQEEIFGPILPILPFDTLDAVIADLKNRPAPLAVYLFSPHAAVAERIMRDLPAGALCVNDLVVHLASKQIPFGGVGESGMGAYHGRASFDCFTHPKTLLRCSTRFDSAFRYPPPRLSLDRFRRVLRFLLSR